MIWLERIFNKRKKANNTITNTTSNEASSPVSSNKITETILQDKTISNIQLGVLELSKLLQSSADGENKPEVIIDLIKKGADPNYKNEGGNSAFHLAARYNHLDVIKAIYKGGGHREIKDSLGCTPLIIAASHGNYDVVKFLLDLGADISHKSIDGKTAVDWANKNNFNNIANLIKQNEKPSIISTEHITPSIKIEDQNCTKIGNQIWMKINLNYDKFQNSDLIPEAKSIDEWQKAVKEKRAACCYHKDYQNDHTNRMRYGKLYNWYAVIDPRGLAPVGWHIPTLQELEIMKQAVSNNGNVLKKKNIGRGGGIGTNESGFSALLAGTRNYESCFMNGLTGFWSCTDYDSNHSWGMVLDDSNSSIKLSDLHILGAYSVRCLKD